MKAFLSIAILSVLLCLGSPVYAGGLLDERDLLTHTEQTGSTTSKANFWKLAITEGGMLFTISEWVELSWKAIYKVIQRQLCSREKGDTDRLPAKTEQPTLICKKCTKPKSAAGLLLLNENPDRTNGLQDEKLTN